MKNYTSNLGYLDYSPYKFNPYNIINSNNITMNGVSKNLLLIPNKGKAVFAKANSGNYYFPNASRVTEIPIYQKAGTVYDNPIFDTRLLQKQNYSSDSRMIENLKVAAEQVKKQNDKENFVKQQYISQSNPKSKLDILKNSELNKQYVYSHPYSKLNNNGDIEQKYPDRNIEGTAIPYSNAAKLDKGLNTLSKGIDAASILTGLYGLGKYAIRNAPKVIGNISNIEKGIRGVDDLGIFTMKEKNKYYNLNEGFVNNKISVSKPNYLRYEKEPLVSKNQFLDSDDKINKYYNDFYSGKIPEDLMFFDYRGSSFPGIKRNNMYLEFNPLEETRKDLAKIAIHKNNLSDSKVPFSNSYTDEFIKNNPKFFINEELKNYKNKPFKTSEFKLRRNKYGGLNSYQKGGQLFQPPGLRKPIFTNNPNDPRIRAYQDSLALYNKGVTDRNNYLQLVNSLDINNKNQWSTSPAPKIKGKIQPISFKRIESVGSESTDYGKGYTTYDLYKNSNTGKTINNPLLGLVEVGNTKINRNNNTVSRGYKEYKKPVQPVIQNQDIYLTPSNHKKEKALKRNKIPQSLIRTNIRDLKIIPNSLNIPLNTEIPNLPYQVDYFDPVLKQRTSKYFPSDVEGSEFLKDLDPATGLPEYRNRGDNYVRGFYNKFQDGGNLPCLECGGNLKKYQDAGSFYKDKKDKIDYLNNISNLYKSLSIGSSAIPYMRSDRTSILNDGVPLDTEHNTCIDVVTGIIKKCGKNLQKRYLDNTDFSDNVTKGSEDAYRVNGNFQLGDIVQAQTQVYPRNGDPNKKYYKPFDSKIIMDIENKNSDDPIYVAVGSSGGSKITKTYYPLSQLKELIGNQERLVTRFGKALDKDKRASSDPMILEILKNKQSLIDYDANNPTLYSYSISENAPNYDKYTKPIIDKFINFANDHKNISALVRSTGRTSEEVQDALLNVFGILGKESNFGAYGKGKGFHLGAFWRNVKNGMEETLTAFPGKSGESYSVGPGQIKFKYLPENLRKKYNIETPDDLYDVEKILPLMVEMDLDNRKTLENLGERGELSKALINKESNLKAEDLEFGVGRWSPYLRNQYNSVVGNNKKTRGTHLVNNTDWIPFNTKRVTNDYKLDPGSYPRKVMDFWRNNLSRKLQQYHGNDINGDPITSDLSEYDIQNKDLPPIILNSKLPKKQNGGRLVDNVPEGYLPLPNKPNYFYKTTNKDVLSQDNLAGQKASSEEWNKFLNSPKGKVWKENQQNTDIVYIQPNQPVKSFDGQLIYKLDNKPAGMYRWKTRDGKILSSNNGQLNDNLVEWSDVDMYGKPTGNILTIPGDVFSNKITKGVNRLYNENLLNTYRTPSLKKGGSLKRYQGPGTSFIGPRPQNWLGSLNMYDTDIKPELWKEASSLNNTEFEKESPVKVPSNLLLKDGESLEQREARLNKKDSDFDYWGTGLNTILAANGLLRWASNNKVEGEKYQNYLNQVHDDDSFNTVMSKDYGNDSYRTLRKGGKLKKYQDGGDDSYDEEDDEVISLLFDDKEESSSSEKNKITESDINNQRKLLKKERKKLLEQQEEIENNTIINEIISQQSRKSNYYGEEEGGGGNFPSSSLEKAQVYKNYLIENHGLSNEQASGFLGNLYAESSLNPSIINPTSGAFGLAQWLGSRKKSLLKFAKDNGKDVNDPFLQLDFAVRELNTTHKNSHLDYNSPKSATVGYLNKFEKPSEEEKRKSFAKRVNFANSIYQQGGTYDLSLDEVQSLINQGYKIKHL